MTRTRDPEAGSVRDALAETQLAGRTRGGLAFATIGPVTETHLPAHANKPHIVVVSWPGFAMHHRFPRREQAEQLHRELCKTYERERETALDRAEEPEVAE